MFIGHISYIVFKYEHASFYPGAIYLLIVKLKGLLSI